MRTEEAMEGWRLSGRIPGAGQEDAAQEDIRLPFALEHFENLASREGMFLRAWELSRGRRIHPTAGRSAYCSRWTACAGRVFCI